MKNIYKILGRKEHKILKKLKNIKLDTLCNKKILITGGSGSIGTALCKKLSQLGVQYISTDIIEGSLYLDITNEKSVEENMNKYKPDIIVNLAAMKYAPLGEIHPEDAFFVNTLGVKNIITYMPKGTKLVQASTCKACNPETVYGSSKLIAERMTLKSQGTVIRFYNVIETQGNVFSIWKNQIKTKKSIDVMQECERYFISINEAIGIILFALCNNKSGIYSVVTKKIRNIGKIANTLYPNVSKNIIKPRKGDRIKEQLFGGNEYIKKYYRNKSIAAIKIK